MKTNSDSLFDKIIKDFNMEELWKPLTKAQSDEYRQWARKNYITGMDIDYLWHPVIKDECRKMNQKIMNQIIKPTNNVF